MSHGMFGISLVELLFICVPVLVILSVILVGSYVVIRNMAATRQNQNQVYRSGVSPQPPAPKAELYCSHCGAGLQYEWSHCPQCGAPIQ
jgi:uncharacterized paraquat-inducible protein A